MTLNFGITGQPATDIKVPEIKPVVLEIQPVVVTKGGVLINTPAVIPAPADPGIKLNIDPNKIQK